MDSIDTDIDTLFPEGIFTDFLESALSSPSSTENELISNEGLYTLPDPIGMDFLNDSAQPIGVNVNQTYQYESKTFDDTVTQQPKVTRGRKRARTQNPESHPSLSTTTVNALDSSPSEQPIEQLVNTRPSRKEKSEPAASTTQLTIPRDQLLVMSSDEFEHIVDQIVAHRPLTVEEKNLVKRQRRLIKNRESAQASRQRKKDYVGDLESKVESLVVGNARLKEDYASLLTENASLKNEVEFLSQLVRRVKVF